MSSRSSASSSRSRNSGDCREIRLPNSRSVKALIYFCGRDPRKAKAVRRYYDDDDMDARSTGSGGSMFSWSSGTSQVYLVESTYPYWYLDEEYAMSYAASSSSGSGRRRKSSSSKTGRSSRTSQRQQPQPTGTWARRHATVEDDDDDDDDDSSDGSFEDYGGPAAGPYPPPPPGMMHPMPQQGPPPGAFQPVYGMPAYPPQHATPHPTPQGGYGPPPPPPPPGGGGGGHFVPGRGGIQVFVAD